MKIIGTIRDGAGVTRTIELERDSYDDQAVADLRASVPTDSTLLSIHTD